MARPYDEIITGCEWENRPHADAVRADGVRDASGETVFMARPYDEIITGCVLRRRRACGRTGHMPVWCGLTGPVRSSRSGDSQARRHGGSGVG